MDSDFHIAFAETEEERRAVYRFRYEIYVEEMGKYKSVADHEQRLFHEPVDEQSRIIYATQNGEVVATARSTWGGDGPIPQRMIDQYDLAPLPGRGAGVGDLGGRARHGDAAPARQRPVPAPDRLVAPLRQRAPHPALLR